MKRILFLLVLLCALPAFGQQANPNNVNVPISQMQNGDPAQAGDEVHIARCNHFGCDYSVTLGSIASLVVGGGYAHEQIVSSGTTATVSQVATSVLVNSATAGAKTITIPASTGSKQIITITDYLGNADPLTGGWAITAVPATGSITGLNQVYTAHGSITLYDSSIGWVSI